MNKMYQLWQYGPRGRARVVGSETAYVVASGPEEALHIALGTGRFGARRKISVQDVQEFDPEFIQQEDVQAALASGETGEATVTTLIPPAWQDAFDRLRRERAW